MSADASDEILKSCPSMGEVVNKAALHLQEGYNIQITIEKDGYGVALKQPNAPIKSFSGDGIMGDVNDAIAWLKDFVFKML